MDLVPVVAFLLIFIGIGLFLFWLLTKQEVKKEWGVGGFIWFIPFGFASSPLLLKLILFLCLVLVIVFLVLRFFL